jgi:hypothetical protein
MGGRCNSRLNLLRNLWGTVLSLSLDGKIDDVSVGSGNLLLTAAAVASIGAALIQHGGNGSIDLITRDGNNGIRSSIDDADLGIALREPQCRPGL